MENSSIAFANVRNGQKEECANILANMARKVAERAIEALRRAEFANDADFQRRVIERADVLSADLTPLFRRLVRDKIVEMVEPTVGVLRRVSGHQGVEVSATNGKMTLPKAFPDSDLTGLLPHDMRMKNESPFKEPGVPTDKTIADVFEIVVEDRGYLQVLAKVNPNLDKLCWQQSQIAIFVREHLAWLRRDGSKNLFPFKNPMEPQPWRSKYVLADVIPYLHHEKPRVHFEEVHDWCSDMCVGQRLILPRSGIIYS